MLSFPIKLKEIRVQKQCSQKQVALGIGISETLYQKYEYGKTKPAYDVIIKLCDYFDVSADYLLGRTDNPNSHKT